MEKITAEVKKQENGELFLVDVIFKKDGYEEKILSGQNISAFKSEEEICSFIRKNSAYSAHQTEGVEIEIIKIH